MNCENKLGKILKKERIKLGMSIRDLADAAGISPTTVCDVEKENNTKHTFNTIAKIANVLDINLNYLADEINNIEEYEENNNTIIIKRVDENIVEFESKNNDLVVDFMKNFTYDFDEIVPNVGDAIMIKFFEDFSDSKQENYYYCPNCNSELN